MHLVDGSMAAKAAALYCLVSAFAEHSYSGSQPCSLILGDGGRNKLCPNGVVALLVGAHKPAGSTNGDSAQGYCHDDEGGSHADSAGQDLTTNRSSNIHICKPKIE